MVDKKLVGAYAFSAAPSMAQWEKYLPSPHIYLLSDFPVRLSAYRHLAKLVLIAALSRESQLLAERTAHKRIRSVVTTAFTDRPISMKYRGLFHLLTRKEKKSGAREGSSISDNYYAQPFELNYGAEIGKWTLAEGLSMWWKKYGEKIDGDSHHQD